MCDIRGIVELVPESIWQMVRKTPQDMAWRSWWHVKWYDCTGQPGEAWSSQKIHNSSHKDVPHERSLFFESVDGRYAPAGVRVAYFGVDHATATCETSDFFRGHRATNEDLQRYFENELKFEPAGFGYPIEYRLDPRVVVADLRHSGNALFTFIADQGPWVNGEDFASQVALSLEASGRAQTQQIAKAAFKCGFNGIWYSSVRTPKNGSFITFAECLVLFEGSEGLIDLWGA